MDYQKILDAFYDEYFRCPTSGEMDDITDGGLRKIKYDYGNYGLFLNKHGYEAEKKSVTYVAYNEKGEFVYGGTAQDLADEFDVTAAVIRMKGNVYGWIHQGTYQIKRKDFFLSDFIKKLDISEVSELDDHINH